MSKKSIALLFLLIISPIIVYFLWPTDEARIRKLVKEGARAVEEEDIDTVMSKVSFGYRDDSGLNYMLLKKTLQREFNALSDIEVEYEALKIEVKEDKATARMEVRVIASMGEERGYIFGDLKEPMHIRLDLEKSPVKKWLVIGSGGQGSPFFE